MREMEAIMPNERIVKKKSEHRGCPVAAECKQCSGQQVTYKEHVEAKQKRVIEYLAPFCSVDPIMRMEDPSYFKNRVHRMFHHEKNGTPMSGYFSPEEGRVVKIDECHIEDKKCQEIIDTIKGMIRSFKIKTYDVKSGYGLLRYVAVRKGVETNDIMVVLVLSSVIMPSKNNFIKALRKVHPEISTILINENYKNVANVFGDKEVTIYGKGFILDSMCGKVFRVSSKSPFPVNSKQKAKVCNLIEQIGGFQGDELVLDTFCGIGTHGIVLADKVRKIYSVESSQELFRDTLTNIKRNQIKNIDVYKNEPTEFLMQMVESDKEAIDVVVVSQPYNGCGQPFIQAIGRAKPKKIVFVSRNLRSLATELELLVKQGYKVEKAGAIDIIPWTDKVECVVLLTRKK